MEPICVGMSLRQLYEYMYSLVAGEGDFAGWGGLLWPGAAALSADAESALNPSPVPMMPSLWQGR